MATARFFYRDPGAPPPNRPPSLGVLAIIEHDGALLLECRSDCGRWSLVGGAVDADESLTEALCREVREETGLDVTDYQLFGTFSDPSRIAQFPDGNVVRVIGVAYLVRVATIDALRLSAESTALRWFVREELPALDIVETVRHIIDAYLTQPPIVLA